MSIVDAARMLLHQARVHDINLGMWDLEKLSKEDKKNILNSEINRRYENIETIIYQLKQKKSIKQIHEDIESVQKKLSREKNLLDMKE